MSEEQKPLFNNQGMKPMMILPPGMMDSAHMEMLRKNGLVVVTCKEPALCRFVDPPAVSSNRTEIERAAIRLSRKLLNPGVWNTSSFYSTDDSLRQSISKMFVELLVKGTELDSQGSEAEQLEARRRQAKREEVERIAREEARAEAAAKKAAKVAAQQPKA